MEQCLLFELKKVGSFEDIMGEYLDKTSRDIQMEFSD